MSEALHKLYKTVLPALLLPLLLASCNVHEWPNEMEEPVNPPVIPENLPLLLNLTFDNDLPLHTEITYTSDANTRSSDDEHQIRYQVAVFEGVRSKGEYASVSYLFTKEIDGSLDYSTEIDLPDGDYEFYIWADYVDKDSQEDKYYNTQDFEYIVLPSQDIHEGSNEKRDAFRGYLSTTIVNSSERNSGNTINIDMKRPMARFEFVATDVKSFLEAEYQKQNLAREATGNDSGDLSDYTITFRYNGYMPSAYNVYTDKACDSWMNITFDSSAENTENGSRLGFDYIFVNEDETSVNVAVGIYDASGNLISSSKNVEVPILRSKNTIVKGEFLSERNSGGIVIDPGYDGDYVIIIP